MRNRFDTELSNLNNNLIFMGSLIENAIARAAKALENFDTELALSVINDDNIIDDKEKEIESMCLKLLLMQQPVARDLRQISSALKMITDLERIGDHASDISELVEYLASYKTGNEYTHIFALISEMARTTIGMVNDSIDAFVKKDETLAHAVIDRDDVVDKIFCDVKNELIKAVRADSDSGEEAFDLLQVAKYYERIGDHAENTAEWVIFSITGVHKNKLVL
ncbi:MAG: phosphate signaling complex protein PhoU [Ruminococcus sp.]|jgi:phosphate transport system protein|nr:phosphate signaling complex protein PhoU [Ruminococcus sp.]